MRVGGVPLVSPSLSLRIAAINDDAVREFVATFPRPGRMWGDPEVTAMRVMFYSSLEKAARLGILDALEAKRQAFNPKRTTDVDPAYDAEATTQPMRRPIPDLGDE